MVNQNKMILIACEVVIKEMSHLIPHHLPVHTIDPSLHVSPDRLRAVIQEAIDKKEQDYSTILLGFGLCSKALEGLKTSRAQMVYPLVDDCIGLFMGSRAAHLELTRDEPGRFFLSRGWIEAGTTPFEELKAIAERCGMEKAVEMTRKLLAHYRALSFIYIPGAGDLSEFKAYAEQKAAEFDLRYGEIQGTSSLFTDMLKGRQSKYLKRLSPGDEIRFESFMQAHG